MAVVGAYALGANGQVLSGKLLRHALGGAFRSSTGVQVVSGVLSGPANTMGELTLVSNTQLTVQPFRAVIANSVDATAGPYVVPNDAVVTFTAGGNPALPAQDAAQYRRALVVVHVDDAQVAGSGASQAYLDVLPGALAASAVAAVLPAVPANGLALGELLLPPTGQAVTLTAYNPRTTARGGILPVLADGSTITGHDGAPPAHDGQFRWHPTNRLEVGIGAGWEHPGPMGVIAVFPWASSSAGVDSNTFVRITGTLNGSVNLRPGRVYRAAWRAQFSCATAGQGFVMMLSVQLATQTPATSDPQIISLGAANAVAGQNGACPYPVEGLFRVSAANTYQINPWLRRASVTPNTGAVSSYTISGTTGGQWIQVEDLGSVAYLQAAGVSNNALPAIAL